jgi:hypothetical protein
MAKKPTKGSSKPAGNVKKAPAKKKVEKPAETPVKTVDETPEPQGTALEFFINESPAVEPVDPPEASEEITKEEAQEVASEIIKDVVEIAVDVIEEAVDHPVSEEIPAVEDIPVNKPLVPSVDDLEEKSLDNWWRSRNKPTDINHFELSYSGVNLSKFGMLEAKVGKFRFKRVHVGANWEITVDESK